MKTQVSLLAGIALIVTISVAQAGELRILSENQMDQVTAGTDQVQLTFGMDQVTFGQGVLTINGAAVKLPDGVNIEVIGNTLILTSPSGVKTTLTDPKNITLTGNLANVLSTTHH